ncbi:MAG: glycine betaine ABC transporter substrate-binding protein [Candidatus Limnocylindrales bacterium]
MASNQRPTRRHLTLLAAAMIVVAACGGGGATTGPTTGATTGPVATGAAVDLTGKSFTIGSKQFTEQLILGAITKLVLEDAGATVKDETGLGGSSVVRDALTSGAIDMYWEYTGTGWITHLKNTAPVVGSQEQFDAVKTADAANDIVWLEPAPFNNTYAIAVASEKATELNNLKTLSELATWANANPTMATLCAAAEFLGRDDGLPGLEKAYATKFVVSELDEGLIYTSTDKGDPCLFGEVFVTDGRIQGLGLLVLEDDKLFFPSYLPSLNVRKSVFDANPDLAMLFAPIAAALDTSTMQALNTQVDIGDDEPADVAREFLTTKGLIGG